MDEELDALDVIADDSEFELSTETDKSSLKPVSTGGE
jgi:hypothetical protein